MQGKRNFFRGEGTTLFVSVFVDTLLKERSAEIFLFVVLSLYHTFYYEQSKLHESLILIISLGPIVG